ncbi:MAG: hypothetical protein U0529_03855 [Thermoanaerobaculia bacterium]
MRHPVLIGASVLALAAIAFAPSAPAQCGEGLKVGSSFDYAVASEDKSIAGKGTITVKKNDGSYVEFTVTSGKQQLMMPGGVSGNQVILTNPKNGTVWVLTCSPVGVEGSSILAGKAMKLTLLRKK